MRYTLGLATLNNNLYAVGGEDNNYPYCFTTAERYDPDLDNWTPIASMGTARSNLGLTAL